MTELTEQQQRVIYEWLREELKGKDWAIDYEAMSRVDVIGIVDGALLVLPPLDYNTFMAEAVPKLTTEDVNVSYNLMGAPDWYLDHLPNPHTVYINTDPWLAVIEYLGREK